MQGTPWWLWMWFGATFGACTGSFLAVAVERVPARESLNGRSRCVCGRQLRWWENVPLLAWPLLGGRARCCGSRIPVWYWLVELYGTVVGAAVSLLPAPVWVQAVVAGALWAAAVPVGIAVRRR